MTSAFSNGTAKVLIVEESGSGRQLLSDVVRSLGFLDITVVSSGRDALDILEVDEADWLVTSSLTRQQINALHLLKVISQQPALRRVRTTLIYEPGDEGLLDVAFALGLMTCHPKTYLRDELQSEFKRMLVIFKGTGWRPPLAAAEYLRAHLHRGKQYDVLVEIEKSLLQLYPGSVSLLLKLGEAQLLAGQLKEGSSTLALAGIIEERAKPLGQAIMQRAIGSRVVPTGNGQPLHNALGIGCCLVVDPDTAVLSTVRSLLESVGVPRIETFDDGDAAWRCLEASPEPARRLVRRPSASCS